MSKSRTKNIKRMKKLNASNRRRRKSVREFEELGIKWRKLALQIVVFAISFLFLWLFKEEIRSLLARTFG